MKLFAYFLLYAATFGAIGYLIGGTTGLWIGAGVVFAWWSILAIFYIGVLVGLSDMFSGPKKFQDYL